MRNQSEPFAWKLVIAAIIIAAIAAFYALSHAFTYEGELDPNTFDSWELVSVIPNPNGLSWVIVKNPDPAGPIKTVALLVDLNSNLLGYRYFKHGEPFGYFFNMDQENYARFEYTPMQKKRCMECHQDRKTDLRIAL